MTKNLCKVAFILASFSNTLFAETEDFSAKDMIDSTKIAADTFKKEQGDDPYNKIVAIQALKSPKGSKIKIHYRDTTPSKEDSNSVKSIEYFCHFHEAQSMDCHEL